MPIKLAENFREPFYVMQALRFHAREGAEVDLINSPAPPAAASDLIAGILGVGEE